MLRTSCKYNDGVRCPDRKHYLDMHKCEPTVICENCGWNPSVSAARLEKIKERRRRND